MTTDPANGGGWPTIDTAPKDGTWILILCPESIQDDDMPKPCVFTARWVEEFHERWEHVDADTQKRVISDHSHWSCYEDPSHWAPIPALPVPPLQGRNREEK